MPQGWNLHYDDWIIGDGEPDRHVDEVFDWFAVACWTKESSQKSKKGRNRLLLPPIMGIA